MTERLVMFFRGFSERFWMALIITILSIIGGFVVSGRWWGAFIVFPVPFFFGLIDLLPPKYFACLIVRRTIIVFFTLILLLILGIVILNKPISNNFFYQSNDNISPVATATNSVNANNDNGRVLADLDSPDETESYTKEALQTQIGFLVLGFILGSLLRLSIGVFVYRSLLCKPRLGILVIGISIWIIVILVFPHSQHIDSIKFYIWGIIIGMFIHKGIKLWLNKKASHERRLQEIGEVWKNIKNQDAIDSEAIRILVKPVLFNFWRSYRLMRKIENWKKDNKDTKFISLIYASILKTRGKYDNAINELDYALKKEPNLWEKESQEYLNIYLNVMKAICLADKHSTSDYDQQSEVSELINALLESEKGLNCPLVNAIHAHRLADEAFKDINKVNFNENALRYARTATNLRRDLVNRDSDRMESKEKNGYTENTLRKFFIYALPITPTFLLDVLGYALLAAGFTFEAKVMFNHCIEADPSYIPAYLHLGDYFMIRGYNLDNVEKANSARRNAEICFNLVEQSVRNKRGRIYRIAKRRLELVN